MTNLSLMRLNPGDRRCRKDMAAPHDMHRSLMSMFPQAPDGSDSPRQHFGVLWRIEPADSPTVLMQSSQAPDFHQLPSGYASCQTKLIDDHLASLEAGQALAYRVVLNPIRISRRSGTEKRTVVPSKERPAWWANLAPKAGLRLHEAPVLTGLHDRYLRRPGAGFPLYSVRVDGTAEIADPELLRAAAAEGIGRAKAWGCGLLTVARLRR